MVWRPSSSRALQSWQEPVRCGGIHHPCHCVQQDMERISTWFAFMFVPACCWFSLTRCWCLRHAVGFPLSCCLVVSHGLFYSWVVFAFFLWQQMFISGFGNFADPQRRFAMWRLWRQWLPCVSWSWICECVCHFLLCPCDTVALVDLPCHSYFVMLGNCLTCLAELPVHTLKYIVSTHAVRYGLNFNNNAKQYIKLLYRWQPGHADLYLSRKRADPKGSHFKQK